MTEPARRSMLKAPWSTMTLPGLLKGAAVLRPDRPLLADGAGTASLAGRPARVLTAPQLLDETRGLAEKLVALGLAAGERVIVQLPNTVEAATGILGVLFAGGVPAMVPAFASKDELVEAATLIDAAGILTMTRFAGLTLALGARDAAVACPSIRFVAASGLNVPDGVTALDRWIWDAGQKRSHRSVFRGTQDGLISFDRVSGGLRALVRTHEHLIAESSAMASIGHIAADSCLLVTIPPVTTVGVVLGLVAPLLTGASAELNALFDGCGFAAQLGKGTGLTVILPAAAEISFREHCAARHVRSETLVLIHRPEKTAIATAPLQRDAAARTIDVTWFGESFGWASKRGARNSDPRLSRHAALDLMAGDAKPLAFIPDAKGQLSVAGPLTPHTLSGTTGPVATGFSETMLDHCVDVLPAKADAA